MTLFDRVPFMLAVAAALAGCDGHMASLSVHDRSSAPAPFLLSVVENDSGKDVPAVVAEVAHSLDLPAMDGTSNRYGKRLPNGYGFSMHVAWSDRQGVWNISLVDWPTIERSALSRQAEKMLRGRLAGLKASD